MNRQDLKSLEISFNHVIRYWKSQRRMKKCEDKIKARNNSNDVVWQLLIPKVNFILGLNGKKSIFVIPKVSDTRNMVIMAVHDARGINHDDKCKSEKITKCILHFDKTMISQLQRKSWQTDCIFWGAKISQGGNFRLTWDTIW